MTIELSKIQDGRTVKCNSNYVGTMRTHEIRKNVVKNYFIF